MIYVGVSVENIIYVKKNILGILINVFARMEDILWVLLTIQ